MEILFISPSTGLRTFHFGRYNKVSLEYRGKLPEQRIVFLIDIYFFKENTMAKAEKSSKKVIEAAPKKSKETTASVKKEAKKAPAAKSKK